MPRPKSFDPDTVLCKAMGVFWEKGYDAASISDLTAAMGINRFSLYDTFGDKHTLYLKALDAYNAQFVEPVLEKIRAIASLDDLEIYFENVIEYQQTKTGKPCCMMQKAAAASAGTDEEACQRVKETRMRFQEAFEGVFARLKKQGDLAEHIEPAAAACLVMTTQSGLLSYTAPPIAPQQARSAIRILIRSLGAGTHVGS